jgi:hypothetical protein
MPIHPRRREMPHHPPAPPRRARQLATVGRKTVPSPHANHSIWSNRAQDLRAPVPRHREIPTGTARAILPPARDPTTNRRVVILPSSPRPLASHRRRRTTKVRGKKSERSPRCCRCERGAAGIQLLGSRARVEPEPLLSGGADTSFRDWSVRPTNCRLRIAPQGAVRDQHPAALAVLSLRLESCSGTPSASRRPFGHENCPKRDSRR